jgi:hypothetical protein
LQIRPVQLGNKIGPLLKDEVVIAGDSDYLDAAVGDGSQPGAEFISQPPLLVDWFSHGAVVARENEKLAIRHLR